MDKQTKEITLPSGRVAAVRTGKGRDLMRAHRAVANNPEPMAVSFALIAELAQVDGKAIVYEDVLAMDLADVLALQNYIVGTGEDSGNFQGTPAREETPVDFSPQPRSRDLSPSASPSEN